MKRIFTLLAISLTMIGLTSCNWEDQPDYKVLAPITISVPSDTINTNTGDVLNYQGLKIQSDLEVSYEWAYGSPKKGTEVNDHEFDKIYQISTNPQIGYTFNKIGTFILRLKVDNGESIALKYFTLNVNAGFDEGIALLSNDKEGKASLSFIKTQTQEEIESGADPFYEDIFKVLNPEYDLKNGTDLIQGEMTSKNEGTLSKFVIATNDEKGRIYQLDSRTMQLLTVSPMKEQHNTFCKGIGGMKVSGGFATYFLGEDQLAYRYDMDFGFIHPVNIDISPLFPEEGVGEKAPAFEHIYEAVYFKSRKTNRIGIWWCPDYAAVRSSANMGVKFAFEEGWEIFNIASKRVCATSSTDDPIYILFRSKSDPTSFQVKKTTDSFRSFKSGPSFKIQDIKMDQDSYIIPTRASQDVYYEYDNAIYRWSLNDAPKSSPSITVPEGEQIRSIATNFKGFVENADGEELLYVATYNPDRAGEHKGSLYIYQFSDHSLIKKYEGKFDDPVKVIYKYRIQ